MVSSPGLIWASSWPGAGLPGRAPQAGCRTCDDPASRTTERHFLEALLVKASVQVRSDSRERAQTSRF